MNVLNPTEAQRKAMGEAADEWQGRVDTTDEYIDRIITAANSVPEGPPVGTIARRPDGGYIAIMNELGWEYFYLDIRKPRLDTDGDYADSWPQLRPDQWPDQSGLDWFPPGEEPLVPRPDPTAQQEPEEDDKPEGCTECGFTAYELEDGRCDQCPPPKPYRTPRVVDRLGVDEQGSRWRDGDGDEWKYRNGWRWRECPDIWAIGNPSPKYAPYTEILEPRVLPSLDCEEARDGTVWSPVDDRIGRRYKFASGSWKSKVGDEEWYTLRSMGLLEERFGPFH
ncbi:hypothetical protein [Mycobacteroides abscessus]|uniref:hypothetical protein n=1 Tax=Mycobacteroides abscessus TaxID=36809 RepID=UPI00232B232E|nr:hypothetical protein [Mycobacteroides abscessus]MDB2213921.1 hypothetical protein [Mycobacteroides abscessus subsp. massiliense]WJJ55520.1 hypothetical protein PROPHIT492_142 [Mycobacterium phage prophiT49-2]